MTVSSGHSSQTSSVAGPLVFGVVALETYASKPLHQWTVDDVKAAINDGYYCVE